MSDGGGVSVAGINRQIIGKGGQFAQGFSEGSGITAGQVGPAGRAAEQGVAREKRVIPFQLPADSAGSVPGCLNQGPMGSRQFQKGGFRDGDHRAFWLWGSWIETGEFVPGRETPCGILCVEIDRGGKQGR